MDRFQCLHPDPGKTGPSIDMGLYLAVRNAILEVVPVGGPGIRWAELADAVALRTPKDLWEQHSLMWYVTVVKLDLEARGEIRRTGTRSPQRLVRTTPA